ncbi:MAG: selenide, water dikinase SelD, partial [Deltaproteobacteria bacterium]
MGFIPGGTIRNRDFRLQMIERGPTLSDVQLLILFDAQTSGGLLISVPEKQARRLLERLHQEGVEEAAIIGEIVDHPKGKIVVNQ